MMQRSTLANNTKGEDGISHSEVVFRPSSHKRRARSVYTRNVIFAVIIVAACLTFLSCVYAIYHLITKVHLEGNNFDFLPGKHEAVSSSSLFSYFSSLEQYRQTIPGLDYSSIQKTPEYMEALMAAPHDPPTQPVGDLLSAWPTRDTNPNKWLSSAAYPSSNSGVLRFDYSDKLSRELALAYRNAEIPFVLYNVPEVERASANLTFSFLSKQFGNKPRIVEKSKDYNFMYWSEKGFQKEFYPDWKPPQDEVEMKFQTFVRQAQTAELRGDISSRNESLYYMTISAGEGLQTPWIRNALPIFTDKEPSFFIVDPDGFMGINCRFGMRGVTAAAHYDGTRNFVVMVRGRKRYILLPPSECKKLDLLPRKHPSGRHSSFDWSDPNNLVSRQDFYNAKATEVVLSMGEVLYIPSYWFHYIISQDASVQCNARSGASPKNFEAMVECGFKDSWDAEKEGKKWRKKRKERAASFANHEGVEEGEGAEGGDGEGNVQVEEEEIFDANTGGRKSGGGNGKSAHHKHHFGDAGWGDVENGLPEGGSNEEAMGSSVKSHPNPKHGHNHNHNSNPNPNSNSNRLRGVHHRSKNGNGNKVKPGHRKLDMGSVGKEKDGGGGAATSGKHKAKIQWALDGSI